MAEEFPRNTSRNEAARGRHIPEHQRRLLDATETNEWYQEVATTRGDVKIKPGAAAQDHYACYERTFIRNHPLARVDTGTVCSLSSTAPTIL